MKKEQISIIGEKEKQLCKALMYFGVSWHEAKILVFFLQRKEGFSGEIERTVELRQPEVSKGINTIFGLGLVQRTIIKKTKKGRPLVKYSMKDPKRTIGQYVEHKIDEKKKQVQDNLQIINDILGGIDDQKTKR